MKNRTIQCKCFPPEDCRNRSSNCASLIGCFYSVHTNALGYIIYERYGCLLNDTLSIFSCYNYPSTSVICCFSSNSSDYCNARLPTAKLQNSSILYFLFFTILWILLFILAFAYFKSNFNRHKKCFSSHSQTIFPEITDSGSGSGKPFLVNRTIARQTTLLLCIGRGRFGEVWRAVCNDETIAVKIFSSRDGASWTRETQIYTTAHLSHPNILAYYASDMISHGGCTQLWLVTAYHANGSLHDFLSTANVVTPQCGLKLARSIAAGLAFLHSEVVGFHGKPSIAHRDIKSKNILVMANNEACLADFGLALMKSPKGVGGGRVNDEARESADAPPPASPFAGTKRYMAPEILALYPLVWGGWMRERPQERQEYENQSAECDEDKLSIPGELLECRHPLLPFEIYLSADIYSLGLVLWEIWRRCMDKQYELPYYDSVPPDPNFLQMYRVVVLGESYDSPCDTLVNLPLPMQVCHLCRHILVGRVGAALENRHHRRHVNGKRPSLSLEENDSSDRVWLIRWAGVIAECWHPCYTHRLSALRVRKTLTAIEAILS
ncbi:unnamed protein product [Hydatigera taeniaeformis]|uniref:receptor protein serine/threonine kinase n=1 Tax=Hydatigena taeniaeformis TaxID=6205 RepID=A0A0R3WIH7_HYDTA|nr:unnamed protein product [Hydatigera taeniaeformis]